MKALVFCSDKIPSSSTATSGGGLRSLQIMELLSGSGFSVDYAIPKSREEFTPPDHFLFKGVYDLSNQKKFIEDENYRVVYWCNPGTIDRKVTIDGNFVCAVDFHGPSNLETVHVTNELLEDATQIEQSVEVVFQRTQNMLPSPSEISDSDPMIG